ncbi:MAG TPA: phosphatidate cytidylyltransferase [Pyrinomonadaceae bacterium]|nr:phosphatidate cytidylyltransferase [Pyrinomonadaceae bacterium]
MSALIGWPAIGAALVYLPERVFGLLAAAAIIVALFEYLRLLVFPRSRLTSWLALVTGVVQILPFLINSLPSTLIILITASLILFAVSVIARSSHAENLLASAFAVAGLVYVVIPLGFIILIRYLPRGIYLLGFLFLVTWARDLGAFLTGRAIGSQNSHVISTSISPRKTYEGAAGGVVASTIVALLTRDWLGHEVPLTYVLLLGMLIGIIGQVGDLVESLMKRVSQVADSSTLIPGQGGLLDTLDSFIYTAPLLYFLLQ